MTVRWLLAFLLALMGFALHAQHADLTVKVEHVRTAQGIVRIALYDNPRFFTKEKGIYDRGARKARQPVTSFRFRVHPGRCYALVSYHDRNHNGKFDRNFIGYPQEPMGFSNNAAPSIIRLSPPTFDEAKVCIRHDTTIVIRLKEY